MLLIFLKFIASAALLFVFYRIVLRGKASYAVSRAYLLALPIVSLIISVLTFEVYPTGTEFAIEQIDFGHYTAPTAPVETDYVPDIAPAQAATTEPAAVPAALPATAPAAEPVQVKQPIVIDWMAMLKWTVPAISLLLLLLAAYHIGKVLAIKSKMDVENTAEGYSLISSPSVNTPFSFAKTIFLPASLHEPGKSMIIRHEKAHIRHRHYADVWFMELITRLFWFNPFVWLCRNELRNVHEFQADHDVIESNVNINAYQTTLLEMVMNVSSPVVNGFNHSFIRQRFIEMKKSAVGTLGRVAKIGTLAWIGVMFCAFTFTEKKAEPISAATETTIEASEEKPAVQTLGAGKFVIEGSVDPGITDSCYLIYFADENFEIIETPVACVPVVDKKFHYEVELNDLTVCRIRCIFPGGEICSDWIETFAAPGVTFGLTVHNGFYSYSNQYAQYLSKIRRLADTYCKNHHLNDGVTKPEGLYKTWENVKYGVWNNQKVKKVEFCEKKTVLTLSAEHWERSGLTSDVCLRDTAGNLYKMLHNESGGTRRYLDYIRGARYSFEPLPKGVTKFDLVSKVNPNVPAELANLFKNNTPGGYTNVIVADITENLNANQKPNFSITFKTELTNEISGCTFEIMSENEMQIGNTRLLGDIDLDNNGEGTFSTYLDEPCIVWVLQTMADGAAIKAYQISIPFVPGENAQFTLTSTGIKRDEGPGFRMEMPSYQLTGSKFYTEWEKAEKKFNEMLDKHGEKANTAINEYVKKNANNLGLVMQYLIGPWNADYSILPQKTLQNPMVKLLKQRNDAWAKEREDALKRREEARANTAPGKMFVDLDLMNMTNTNNRPSLSDIVGKGRHVLVHFSYSDDGAIKDSVEALWKKQKGGKVDVIGIKCTHISMSNFYDKIYKDMGISYKMYYDTSHKSSQYGLGGKDEVILFGPDGTILWRDIAADELELTIENVLNGKATTHPVYSNPLQDSKFKAMNIYNFTKQVEWPASETKGDFVICVVNQDNMLKQLESITKGKTVGKSTISVVGAKNIEEISKCSILY
ncbi:MAG: DUF4154 domain-containing protein [Salinivirgaceae bacterium]|nr:DUF4154 domain-containing protein [Salinivirgaceae bacterium]